MTAPFIRDESSYGTSEKRPNQNKDDGGVPAIHWAITEGHIVRARLLLQQGTDTDIKSRHGMTTLHQAVFVQHGELVGMLLEYGANPNVRDY